MDEPNMSADEITSRLFDYWTGGADEDHVHLVVRRSIKGIEVQLGDVRSEHSETLTDALRDVHGKFLERAKKDVERVSTAAVNLVNNLARLG